MNHSCCALLDFRSMGDFISSMTADQLELKWIELVTLLPLQLAVQGSHLKINFGVCCMFEYQDIKCEHYFDIANLSNYNVILGMPWLFQHQVTIRFNSSHVVVGSMMLQPLEGLSVAVLESRAAVIYNELLAAYQHELINYAHPLFKKATETLLPPLRAINHAIPLIEPEKIYPWWPSWCPKLFREQWNMKQKGLY
ncbi:hypothetical protein ARMSODRAFT_986667 [Armillaria solidipes]|uniref:Uncharacterized protein n=1 Tax=Armillaria solidipes TaxID=1076256 RepID=A0A2H3BS66_9AGAR|nr:hypothetical protein ARMSODRAFT_986667 [Armillaria solidipes]